MKKNHLHISLLIPIGVFLFHTFLYRNWLVDDAAISLAYAQNLGDGHGLVSQPGRIPVEAFSNPLWVFILGLCRKVGLWHIYATPKILATIGVVLAITLSHRIFTKVFCLPHIASILILCLSVSNAPFVCWLSAGLENGLFVFLLTVFIYFLLNGDPKNGLGIGLLLGSLALVRPEALLFGLPTLAWLAFQGRAELLNNTLRTGAGFFLTFGIYMIFRKFYFGDWVPNPFYVKMGLGASGTNYFLKIHHLFRSLFGPFGFLGAIGMMVGSIWIIRKRKWKQELVLLFLLWLMSVASFLILPYDHLGWYRYASGFIWLSYLLIGGIVCRLLLEYGNKLSTQKLLLFVLSGIFLVAHIGMASLIAQKRLSDLPVPYQRVAFRYGEELNQIGHENAFDKGAIVVPDLGGTLLHSNYLVYDFPGLVDPVIAKTYQKDPVAFTDYLFEVIQPVMISSHGLWLEGQDWMKDTRLEQDYQVFERKIGEGGLERIIWLRKRR
ncbi:MAG: hypothetical protein MRZ79_17475 [Bacteroidia bacterium]|nr:hypothetical protein [Bacteroidia bacterium]